VLSNKIPQLSFNEFFQKSFKENVNSLQTLFTENEESTLTKNSYLRSNN